MWLNHKRKFFSKITETAHRASSERALRTRPIQNIQSIQFQWRVA